MFASVAGMRTVRLGIIGLGGMGGVHAKAVTDGQVGRVQLTAVADPRIAELSVPPGAKPFARSSDLLRAGLVDAVLIATPHYAHTTIGMAALRRGLHVLMEKPLSVHKADCERLLAAHTDPRQVFAVMFNQRTDPFYRKLREMVAAGELGELRRLNWIITNWFRTAAYYASGGWRATWAGEGGGVLLNQCPHNLDLFQWMFGMPVRVRAFCQLGRYHPIEVEDDVTAYFEYPNGATGVFITSTGEAPGTNRLEVTAERGKIVYENDTLTFTRNEIPMSEFSRTSPERFAAPPCTEIKIPVAGHGGQHPEIIQNFVDAILDGAPLLAPAADGVHSVELANAMLLSSLKGRTIELPLHAAQYARVLRGLIRGSKPPAHDNHRATSTDLTGSFGH